MRYTTLLLLACAEPPEVSAAPDAALVEGTVTSTEVTTMVGAVPRTTVRLETDDGEEIAFVVPGSNGPPTAVSGVPALHAGERWRADLVLGSGGWTPRGLGEGLELVGGGVRYQLNGLHYDADQLPRTFLLNGSIPGLTVEESENEVQAALNQWTSVRCADFTFAYGGTTELLTEADGQNVMKWETAEWPYDEAVAGFTATQFDFSGEQPRPAEADILFNGVTWDWTLEPGDVYANPARLNAASVVVHELGHVTGMDHEYERITSTMFYAYLGGDWPGTLAGDDRRGLCENYPNGEHECSEDSDCEDVDGTPRTCVEIEGIRVCDEVRDPVGAQCHRTYINCEQYCVFTNSTATDGYCTVDCAYDTDCPDGFVCNTTDDLFLPETDGLLCVPDDDADTESPPVDSDSSGATTDTDAEMRTACGCATRVPAEGVAHTFAITALVVRFRSRRRWLPGKAPHG